MINSTNADLGYNVAINFFGNYDREIHKIKTGTQSVDIAMRKMGSAGGGVSMFNRAMGGMQGGLGRASSGVAMLTSSLFSLRGLLIGGGLVGSLAMLGNNLFQTGLRMEQNFASIKTAMGDEAKTVEGLLWARQKAAETPFDLPDVNQALLSMSRDGYTKSKELREKVFTSIGDMAGAEGFDFGSAMYMFSKAGEGNWQQMAMRTGLRAGRMKSMAIQSERTDEEKKKMIEYANVVNTAAAGTAKYKEALADYLGIMYKGGMENRVKTVGGALSNVGDLMKIFTMEIVGYSQQADSFFYQVSETIREKFLNTFSKVVEVQKDVNGNVTKQITLQEKLFDSGKRIGNILKIMWKSVDSAVESLTGRLEGLVMGMNKWLADFQGNVAPMIIALTIMKMRVRDFFTGFKEGFGKGFMFFWNILVGIIKTIGKVIGWFKRLRGESEETENKAMALGNTIGLLVGSLLGLRILLPLTTKLMSFGKALGYVTAESIKLFKSFSKDGKNMKMLSSGLDTAHYRALQLKSGVSSLALGFRGMLPTIASVTSSIWAMGAAFMATPIGWIVAGLVAIAGAAYLVYKNYDKIKEQVEKIPDAALIGSPSLLLMKYDKEVKKIAENNGKLVKDWKSRVADEMTMIWWDFTDFVKRVWRSTTQSISEYFAPQVELLKGMWENLKETFGRFDEWFKDTLPGVREFFIKIGGYYDKYMIKPMQWIKKNIVGLFGEKDFFRKKLEGVEETQQGWLDTSAGKTYNTAKEKYLRGVDENRTRDVTLNRDGKAVYSLADILKADADKYKQGSEIDTIVEKVLAMQGDQKQMLIQSVEIRVENGENFNADKFIETLEQITSSSGS